MRKGGGCGQRDCANVPVWVRDAKGRKSSLYRIGRGVASSRCLRALLTHIHGTGLVFVPDRFWALEAN